MDLSEVFARPLTPEDFQRLRSAWKIPNDVPDKHIMKYINSQKAKGRRMGEDEDGMDEDILDIKHRAGISTNWDRDAALRALATIENAMVDLLDELYGIEDREQRARLISMVQDGGPDIVAIRNMLRQTS